LLSQEEGLLKLPKHLERENSQNVNKIKNPSKINLSEARYEKQH
jgi:hypothetical protein